MKIEREQGTPAECAMLSKWQDRPATGPPKAKIKVEIVTALLIKYLDISLSGLGSVPANLKLSCFAILLK